MSSLYAVAGQRLLTGGLTWAGAQVFVTLLGGAYVPDFENDMTFDDVPPAAVLSVSLPLTGLAAARGIASAASVSFGSITTTAPIVAILLSLQQGVEAGGVDQLLMYLDQGIGFGGRPVNTVTGIVWDAAGIWMP